MNENINETIIIDEPTDKIVNINVSKLKRRAAIAAGVVGVAAAAYVVIKLSGGEEVVEAIVTEIPTIN